MRANEFGSYVSQRKDIPLAEHRQYNQTIHQYLQQAGFNVPIFTSDGKGIVFVNGHHVGRYWKVGPQQTLYIPGCWLSKGKNDLVIFEEQHDTEHTVLKNVEEPILESIASE